MTAEAHRTCIRPFQAGDEEDVVGVWHRSGQTTYTFLPTWQAFTLARARTVFREVIRHRCDVWVATLDDQIVAYLAMDGPYIDRLYVDPPHWRTGWGALLLEFAKRRFPEGLSLHTHQENHAARAFYEKHKFEPIAFGMSPPPESAPDIEYRWTPS